MDSRQQYEIFNKIKKYLKMTQSNLETPDNINWLLPSTVFFMKDVHFW